MNRLTSLEPESGEALEDVVLQIVSECGMTANRKVKTKLARGMAELDVVASEEIKGIIHIIAFECKNWNRRVDQGVVHSFRTILNDSGIHQGYIISKNGFQSGAFEASQYTNVKLLDFAQFQEHFFKKWCDRKLTFLNVRFQFLENFFVRQFYSRWVNFFIDEDDNLSRRKYFEEVEKYRYIYCNIVSVVIPFDKDRTVNIMELHKANIDEMVKHDVAFPDELSQVRDVRSIINLLCEHIDDAVVKKLYEINPGIGGILLAGLDQALEKERELTTG